VGRAREFASRTLASWGAEHLEDDVRVVASELATNALLHARTPFTVRLTMDGGIVRMTMVDASPVRPRMRRFDVAESSTGRGLRMVAHLTQAWGVEQDGVGKAVWCELSAAPELGSGAARVRAEEPGDEKDVEEDVEALLAMYDDDGDATPRAMLSSCGSRRSQIVVRVVA